MLSLYSRVLALVKFVTTGDHGYAIWTLGKAGKAEEKSHWEERVHHEAIGAIEWNGRSWWLQQATDEVLNGETVGGV